MKRRTTTFYNNIQPNDTEEFPPPAPPSSRPPVAYHAEAAVIAGGLVATAVGVILNMGLGWDLVQSARWAMVAGVIVSCVGVLTTLAATNYDLIVDWSERRRRWQQAAAAPQWIEPENEPAPGAAPRPRDLELERIARAILERQFLDGLSTTRAECESAGICTQPEWNILNLTFKDAGLRDGKKWVVSSYAEAVQKWRQSVRIEPTAVVVEVAPNQWKRIPL